MVFRSVYNGKPVLEEKSDEKKDSVCFIRGPFFFFLKGAQMEKKMRNILIALIIGFQVFPITVYGKGKDAFLAYQEAMQKTVVSGNWKEELDMDADMTIIQGKAKNEKRKLHWMQLQRYLVMMRMTVLQFK